VSQQINNPWTNAGPVGPVTLLLGWRPRPRRLAAQRVDLGADFAGDLRDFAARWVARVGEMNPVAYDYGTDPHLEPDEFLDVPFSALPSPRDRTTERSALDTDGADEHEEEADLRRIVMEAFDNDDFLDAQQLGSTRYLFYCLVTRTPQGQVGLVKQTGPQRLAKAGGFLAFFSDSLRRLEQPVFVLEPDIDLLVSMDRIAVLRPLAFERLCSDLQLSEADVPLHVETLGHALPLTANAREALEKACRRGARSARHLRQLAALPAESWQTRDADSIREVVARRCLDPGDFLTARGEIDVEEANVPVLLEMLASRYYTSDFDNEQMRADRARRRLT
jgi:hypothetical protein